MDKKGQRAKKCVKGTKICVVKQKLKLGDYAHCVEATQLKIDIDIKSKKRFKSENIKQHNTSWSQIPDHSCKILKMGG